MENQNGMTDQQLEGELSKHRALSVLGKVLMYGSVALMIILLITGASLLVLLLLIPAIAGAIISSNHDGAAKSLLSDNVTRTVVDELLSDTEYNPSGRISDEAIGSAGMLFPFTYNHTEGSDYIKGTYKGVPLELSDIEFSEEHTVRSENGGTDSKTSKNVFKGQWISCDFGAELSCRVRLSEYSRKLDKQVGEGSILTDNEAFNSRFIIRASDPQEAYRLLTPQMMDAILAAADGCGGGMYMSFLQSGKLHIAIPSGCNFFELEKGSADPAELRRKFADELQWLMNIIDELKLGASLPEEAAEAPADGE